VTDTAQEAIAIFEPGVPDRELGELPGVDAARTSSSTATAPSTSSSRCR
jgi:hypothetical protein